MRSNQKVQLKNSGWQKESNRTKQQKTNDKRNKLRLLFWIQGNFYSGKNLFELVKWKEGFETKLQALELPDSDIRAKSYTRTKIGSKEGFETKLQALELPDSDIRAKSYTRTKIGSEIAIRNNRGKSEKKKNDEQINERSLSGSKRRTRLLNE